jgi:hypothetical protein
MATPTRQEIEHYARELWHTQEARNGNPAFDIEPELSELRETGLLSQAMSELMTNKPSRAVEQYSDYIRAMENFADFSVDVTEAIKSGIYVSGTTGSGKSDVGMYAVDAIKEAYPQTIFITFDPSQDWQTRSSIARIQTLESAYINSILEQSLIYDISMLSVRQCAEAVERFNKILMRQQAEQQAEQQAKKQYFIVFEESQMYFPEGCMRSKRYENTVRMMTQGRNFKVRFMCITQFASLIDKNAMRYMKQRYFGFTDEPNDLSYIKRIIGNEAEELRELNAGELLYWHRGKVSRVNIEPFSGTTAKTEVFTAVPLAAIPAAPQPQSVDWAPLAKVALIGALGLLFLLGAVA